MKDRFIHFYINDHLVLLLRLLAFIVSIPFAMEVCEIWNSGYAENRFFSANEGERRYYSILVKNIIYLLLFLWFSTGGIRKKSTKKKDGD